MTACDPGLHAYTPAMTPPGRERRAPATTTNDGGYWRGPMDMGHPGNTRDIQGDGVTQGSEGCMWALCRLLIGVLLPHFWEQAISRRSPDTTAWRHKEIAAERNWR
eukprot:gene24640-10262_t